MSKTGECGKCASEISIEAERCPECGYEPSNSGLVTTLVDLISLGVFLFSGLIVVIMPILLFDGTDISTVVFGFAFFGFFALLSGGYFYSRYKKTQLTPVNDELFDI